MCSNTQRANAHGRPKRDGISRRMDAYEHSYAENCEEGGQEDQQVNALLHQKNVSPAPGTQVQVSVSPMKSDNTVLSSWLISVILRHPLLDKSHSR